jgi:hypothetical protein
LDENKNPTKPSIIIAAATTVIVIISVAMILGIQSQTWHTALAQTTNRNTTTPATNTVVRVTPSQSTNKTFWISTVHLDGTTTIHKGLACDNCTQNTPPHPAETFPNAKLPAGPGLVLSHPTK